MAGRATVNRKVQIGVETTPGTPVPANKTLPSMSLTLTRTIESRDFRAQGFKPPTVSQIVKDYGTGTLSGPLNYTELVYPLSSLVQATISTPGGGTNSRDWTFTPAGTGADTFKTFTIEEGDSDAATQMANSCFYEFGITANLNEATVNGAIYGGIPATGTLTGSPTAIAQLPVNVREIDLFMDSTFGAIGTTKITDHLSCTFSITNKYGLKWVLNTANTSFKDIIELPPTLAFSFETEHNSQSRTLYSSLNTNPLKYFRFKATGPIIEASIPYKVQLDAACYVRGTEQTDVDGVWGYRYDCLPVFTSSLSAWSMVVTNNLTAL